MKILSLECTAGPASAAITEDGRVIASSFVNVKLTHSQTLLPMAEGLFAASRLGLSDIDGIAVTAGPGSFTGVRIGISAAKGLAAARNLPCAGVSTLLSLAFNYRDTDCIVCAVMDARCSQVYNAIFEISVPQNWIGKSIGRLDIRKKYNINIMALKQSGKMNMNISHQCIMI